MKLYLIRHGATSGNEEGRYVGSTDENLSEKGKNDLKAQQLSMPKAEAVFSGPMKRCRESAALLFPGKKVITFEGIRECDFGRFEYKNYQELNGDPDYQAWIDSGGMTAFPGGESRNEYIDYACGSFEAFVRRLPAAESAALICHGGYIMAVLDRFSSPHSDYFSWQVRNGQGFEMTLDPEAFKAGRQCLTEIRKLQD